MPPSVSETCQRCAGRHGGSERCADGLTSGRFRQPTTTLADHLRWLESIGAKPCSCRFAWRSLGWHDTGRVHRSAGYGWVRMNTDPRCPEHGRDAAAMPARVGAPGVGGDLPRICHGCGRVMSQREWDEQRACNDCAGKP